MARCKNISPTKRKLCVGSLRHKIHVFDRDLAPPAFNSQSNRQVYTPRASVFAAFQTTNGIDVFDGIEVSGQDGIPQTATIFFFIRHRTDITAQNYIQFRNINYDILRVEPIDLGQEWLKIFAAPRGDVAKESAR